MRGGRALLVLLLALLSGCITEEREQELGDQIAAQINAHLPLVRDPALNRYVNRLGNLIARESARPDVPYRFYIVDSPEVNAFALPGGHIYVNRGLIERTESVSQLAGVLAHEIGHVAARHGAEMMERRLRTGALVSTLYDLILGTEPALLDQRALQMGRALWVASHSREAEEEADKLAVEYLVAAGVDPRGIITLLAGLLQEEKETGVPHLGWFATHPMTADRIALTRREIREELPEDPRALASDIPSYTLFLRRLEALPPPPAPRPMPMP